MKKISLVIGCCLLVAASSGQNITKRIEKAFRQFEADSQLKHATVSLYVIDAGTGKVVFDRNSQTGLAPASTQKIFTAAAAFDLLGKDFRYKTDLGYDGAIEGDVLKGNLLIMGRGDPTLGSWRYATTHDTDVLKKWVDAVSKLRIKHIEGDIIAVDNKFESQTTPDGWIWQDIGNYYGAGVMGLNWHENQYDLRLSPGKKVGDSARIIGTYPELEYRSLINELKTGPKGSGDNAYIYYPPYSSNGFVRGTIPLGEDPFKISGSLPVPSRYPAMFLAEKLKRTGITTKGNGPAASMDYAENRKSQLSPVTVILSHYSPQLDSIVYWFLQKSINLYGEALLKTLALESKGFGSTESGVTIVKEFWRQNGVEEGELNIYDGSGLSPLNRVTTHAQVEVLKYAKRKEWFPSFYEALPVYNGMKMKSGSINDVKGYCGYQKAGDGHEYIFSFLVNNYNGKSSLLVNKMFKVLDVMK